MLTLIIGDKGSGKSLTAVRNICIHKDKLAFTNFPLIGLKNFIRLREDDVILPSGKGFTPNWDFWEKVQAKFKDFDIYIDEISQIEMLNSKQHGGKSSVAGGKWVAQVRKALGDSRSSNMYLICQNVEQLNASWRRLVDCVVFCTKKEIKRKDGTVRTYIYLFTFKSSGLEHCMMLFDAFRAGAKSWNRKPYRFIAEPYYKYYSSKKFIRKEEGLL